MTMLRVEEKPVFEFGECDNCDISHEFKEI